jgi:hypothetical protein
VSCEVSLSVECLVRPRRVSRILNTHMIVGLAALRRLTDAGVHEEGTLLSAAFRVHPPSCAHSTFLWCVRDILFIAIE